MTHKFGPNGHIVDAFIAHIKGMTPEQWKPVIAAWDAAGDAAGYAAGDAAGDAARDAAWAAGDAAWDAAWAAGDAAWEIQGADLMRERGQPFFFLPMFGFADETAIIQPATQAMDELVAESERLGMYPPAYDALVDSLRANDEAIYLPLLGRAADAIEALRQEVKALHTAGHKLGYYAGHADDCEDVTGAYAGSCSCGYRAAWQQWRAALGDKL